jgi:hypothetical protein
VCPTCGHNYLHQGKVVVCNRRGEDAPGIAVTVENQDVKMEPLDNAGFMGRRDDLTIFFFCESCCGPEREATHMLTIHQHKGLTLVRWHEIEAGPDE